MGEVSRHVGTVTRGQGRTCRLSHRALRARVGAAPRAALAASRQGPASLLVRHGMGSGFISRSDDVPDPIAEVFGSRL